MEILIPVVFNLSQQKKSWKKHTHSTYFSGGVVDGCAEIGVDLMKKGSYETFVDRLSQDHIPSYVHRPRQFCSQVLQHFRIQSQTRTYTVQEPSSCRTRKYFQRTINARKPSHSRRHHLCTVHILASADPLIHFPP